jgi:hypothetical protein
VWLFNQAPAPEPETMPQKLPKIVLVLIVLMAVCSPFMQFDSWDNFPVGTGDIEMHMISVLFETGMFFVIAGILKLFPALLRSGYRPPTMTFASFVREAAPLQTVFSSFAVPLRI